MIAITQLSNANKHNYMEFKGYVNFHDLEISICDQSYQSSDIFQLLAVKVLVQGSYNIKSFADLIHAVVSLDGCSIKIDNDEIGHVLELYTSLGKVYSIYNGNETTLHSVESAVMMMTAFVD